MSRNMVVVLAIFFAVVGTGVAVSAQSPLLPGKLAIYYGFPSAVNGSARDLDAAANEFNKYDIVVLGNSLQFPQYTGAPGQDPNYGCTQNSHYDHDNTVGIISRLNTMGTAVYGYVSIGGENTAWICNLVATPLTMAEITSHVDAWAAMGVAGIFFDEAEYGFGCSRERQNDAVDYVHSKGLSVFINGWNPDDIFKAEVVGTVFYTTGSFRNTWSTIQMNPTGETTHLGPADIYLMESYQIINGNYQDPGDWVSRSDKALAYKAQYGTRVATVTTPTPDKTYDSIDQEKFDYAWWSTLLYGFDSMGWGEANDYSSWGPYADKLLNHTRPDPGDIGSAFTSPVSHASPVHTRTTTTGMIEVNTNTHTGGFLNATFIVTSTADFGAGTLREAINAANTKPGPDIIVFNIPGDGPHTIRPTSPLPPITDPVIIDGYSQPGASPNTNPPELGTNAVLKIELDGSNAGPNANGLDITAGGSTVRGLVINRFGAPADLSVNNRWLQVGNGIFLHTEGGHLPLEDQKGNNHIEGNFIGTDVTGSVDVGNGGHGVQMYYSPGNVIGGTDADARNVISGNGVCGIQGSANNVIQGNLIGTDVTGTRDLGNSLDGVNLDNGYNNMVGGTTAAARNILSGNGRNGVVVASGARGNIIQGNFIGTDVTGTVRLGNTSSGVFISNGPQTTVGGTEAGARNLISGNGQNGIVISAGGIPVDPCDVQGNYIGTDITGTADLGNSRTGIRIESRGNTIGGVTPGAGNLISGNDLHGLSILGGYSAGNVVQGNSIGTSVDGTAALGNTYDGVYLINVNRITIGGTATGAGNTIAKNGRNGVFVFVEPGTGNATLGTGIAILGNAIFENGGLGIDLAPAGVTPNDTGDGDTGVNNLQNFPVLTSATSDNTTTTIQGTLNSTPDTTLFTLEFFSNTARDASGFGEGQNFIGLRMVTTDGSGNASFTVTFPTTVLVGQFITATATDPGNNTSEFSECLVTTGNTPIGESVVVEPVDATTMTAPVTVTFTEVTEVGTTSLTTSSFGPPPSGFELGDPPTYYELATTASFSGLITVCMNYSGIRFVNESKLKLFHFEGGRWVDRTISLDTNTKEICAEVTSLSPFVIAVDTTPPTLTVTLSPNVLWPPDHTLIAIHATVTVSDDFDPNPSFVLTSIVSSEPDNGLGDGDTPHDIQEADLGKADVDFKLRAERSGKGDGRVYTVTYTATDASGNRATASDAVMVPHDKGKGKGRAKLAPLPETYALEQNTPNPFNVSTTITYALPERSYVRLSIYNLLGQEVARVVDGDQEAGYHAVVWDASERSAGMYLYRLEAGTFDEVKRMLLLK